MNRSLLSVAAACALLLSACSGDGEEAEAKEAIAVHLMDQQEDAQMLALEQDEADCIADGMVDGIGVDQLKEYGFLNEDGSVNKESETPEMSQGDAEVMVDSMFDCTDVMATMKEEMSSTLGQQPAETQKCFEDALTEDVVRGVLVATFTGEEQKAQQELMEPFGACMTGMEQPDNG
ncbi:MAG TPA: hypothetical protein VFZ64_07770 [Nocardioidaceae bacterium]